MTAVVGSHRLRVLHLYRQILRTARTWEGSEEERIYIQEEARIKFRENSNEVDGKVSTELLQEAEERLEYGKHYGIPYPRLQHASQFHKQYFLQAPKIGSHQEKDYGNPKLAAAAARRRKEQGS